MTGGRLGRWVVSRDKLLYGSGHDHYTTGCACDTAGEVATWRATARAGGRGYMAHGTARDTAGCALRHDQARPATRRSARAVCTQAGPRVGALCT